MRASAAQVIWSVRLTLNSKDICDSVSSCMALQVSVQPLAPKVREFGAYFICWLTFRIGETARSLMPATRPALRRPDPAGATSGNLATFARPS